LPAIETQCGAFALKISGEPIVQLYCHCDDCQSAQSAAYVKAAIYPAAAVEIARGAPVASAVISLQRMRCAGCGTYLFAEIETVGGRSVNSYLLPEGVFKPQFHVQCQYAALPVVDELPHYRGFPAAFGGREEYVAW